MRVASKGASAGETVEEFRGPAFLIFAIVRRVPWKRSDPSLSQATHFPKTDEINFSQRCYPRNSLFQFLSKPIDTPPFGPKQFPHAMRRDGPARPGMTPTRGGFFISATPPLPCWRGILTGTSHHLFGDRSIKLGAIPESVQRTPTANGKTNVEPPKRNKEIHKSGNYKQRTVGYAQNVFILLESRIEIMQSFFSCGFQVFKNTNCYGHKKRAVLCFYGTFSSPHCNIKPPM